MDKDPFFRLSFDDGSEYLATKDNASAFLHLGRMACYDHIFIQLEPNPEEEPKGLYCFREQLDIFDETVEYMEQTGFTVIRTEKVTPFDKQTYDDWKISEQVKKLDQPHFTSPRAEQDFQNHLQYILYLIDHDLLNEGDL